MWIRCFYAEVFAQKPRINQISRTGYGFPALKVPGAELSVISETNFAGDC
jgi:hypothetical protein